MTSARGSVEREPLDVVESAEHEASTRRRVLHLVVSRGPVAAGELAGALGLTAPAVRRHLAALEADGAIVAREAAGSAPRGRGRPARLFVATARAHGELASSYAELAVDALAYLGQVAGPDAVAAFAQTRSAELERRYVGAVTGSGRPADRADALARALTDDGYEATSRPVPGTAMVQLCQGHCPVQHVAERFPDLCDAETQAFSRLLGVHVQRLATLATGGHACTTNVPTGLTPVPTSPTPAEGPR